MIEEFTKLEKLYTEFSEAYRAFAEKDRQACTTISIVSRRITDAKKETDDGIAECKTIIADVTRSTAAQTAAAIRMEVLLSRTFPITEQETEAMNQAVAAADAAYYAAMHARSDYDAAHQEARRKLKEMRDGVFGNTPGSMNLIHTNQVLHDRLSAVHKEAK